MQCPKCDYIFRDELLFKRKSELIQMLGDLMNLESLKVKEKDGSYYYEGISEGLPKKALIAMITKMEEISLKLNKK